MHKMKRNYLFAQRLGLRPDTTQKYYRHLERAGRLYWRSVWKRKKVPVKKKAAHQMANQKHRSKWTKRESTGPGDKTDLKTQPQPEYSTKVWFSHHGKQATFISVSRMYQPGCSLGTASLLLHMALTLVLPSIDKELPASCPPPSTNTGHQERLLLT